VAVLAAMYGQTSGAAGAALRGMDRAYPVAMRYLRAAEAAGRAGEPVRTYGGRLVRMWGGDGTESPAAVAARGRFARNAVVQGAAAELFKAGALTVRARLDALGGPLPCRIVLCLHDELLVQAPEALSGHVADLLRDALADVGRWWCPPGQQVRLVADVSVVTAWSQAKP
jgi:DNA polymerase-1